MKDDVGGRKAKGRGSVRQMKVGTPSPPDTVYTRCARHINLQLHAKYKHHRNSQTPKEISIVSARLFLPIQDVIRLLLKRDDVSCKPSIRFFSHQFSYAVESFHLHNPVFICAAEISFIMLTQMLTILPISGNQSLSASFAKDKQPFEKSEQHLSFKPAATLF